MGYKIGLVLFLGSLSFSNTINVPGDFSGIQDAINASDDGDTVFVAAGTYTHYEEFNYYGKSIALVGENKETTILDGQDTHKVISLGSDGTANASILNFTLINGFSNNSQGAAITISEYESFKIENCIREAITWDHELPCEIINKNKNKNKKIYLVL